MLVYLVIYDSGQVSLEHLLLLRHPSQSSLTTQWTVCLSSTVNLSGPNRVEGLVWYTLGHETLMYSLISFRKSTPLRNRHTDILISYSQKYADIFGGGVGLLKLINEYIL